MKRNLKIICVFIVMINYIFVGCTSFSGIGGENRFYLCNNEKVYNYDDVKDIVIRFHVLANSDSDEDQNLKLKVRDEILNYLSPYIKSSNSVEEARQIMLDKKDEIKKISLKVIKENGYNYDVKTELARENFPEKSYGSSTFPQGEYEAFRVIIGNGDGHNWWCVMFPALCFIDVTKGQVEENESREELDKAVEEGKENKKESDVKVKFKIVEIFNKFFK